MQDWLDMTAKGVLLEALKEEKTPGPWGMVADILKQVNVYDLCMEIFDTKHPETGEPINKGLTLEYLQEYLDTPSARKVILTFIEVNELEEALGNLQSLPVVGSLMEALKSTFGLPFLTHLQTSTDSPQTQLEDSHSRNSTSISEDSTGGTPASGLSEVESQKPKQPYKM
jgi:hypothetical protein